MSLYEMLDSIQIRRILNFINFMQLMCIPFYFRTNRRTSLLFPLYMFTNDTRRRQYHVYSDIFHQKWCIHQCSTNVNHLSCLSFCTLCLSQWPVCIGDHPHPNLEHLLYGIGMKLPWTSFLSFPGKPCDLIPVVCLVVQVTTTLLHGPPYTRPYSPFPESFRKHFM